MGSPCSWQELGSTQIASLQVGSQENLEPSSMTLRTVIFSISLDLPMIVSPTLTTWRDTLMISRPGLWFVMVWLYLWPTGGHWNVLQTFPFYIGLLSCTLPFNLLMFGMNDMVDFDVDQLHARKGNYTWGARASKLELAQLPLLMVISNLCPMVILVAATGHLSSLIWVLGFLLCNIIYNLPPMAVARKGPWEFPCMLFGISCITMFSCDVNNVPTPSIGNTIAQLISWFQALRCRR